MKNILVIDPYDSSKHADTLQKIFEREAIVTPFSKDADPEEILDSAYSLIATGKSSLENEKLSNVENSKYDIIFVSAMMIRTKKINIEEVVEKYATEKPTIVVMSSLGDKVPLKKWDVRYLHKDKINTLFSFITEETKKEVRSFLN